MKNIIKILVATILFILAANPASAQIVADHSAKILNIKPKKFNVLNYSKKRLAINKVLSKYNSPLLDSVNSFLATCQTYELNCYLLPSIAGLESSFGKHILAGSYNPFGWGGGYILFKNWDQAINTVGKGLRENYVNKGAETVDEIAPIYAESLTWAPRVKYFMNVFEEEEKKFDLILGDNWVEL